MPGRSTSRASPRITWCRSMAERKGESSENLLWAGKIFDLQRGDIWSVDANGNRERAAKLLPIIEALRRIPDLPERPDEIRQSAFNIAAVAMFAALHDQPNLQQNPGGTAADLRELQRAHGLCFELAHHLYQMHRGSRAVLEKHDPRGLRKFQKEVAKWSDLANEAWLDINESEHRASRRGRPLKDVAAAVRSVALGEYEHLTGQPAARKGSDYGPFVDFFRDLFGALGLNPKDAAAQARRAIEERGTVLGKKHQ